MRGDFGTRHTSQLGNEAGKRSCGSRVLAERRTAAKQLHSARAVRMMARIRRLGWVGKTLREARARQRMIIRVSMVRVSTVRGVSSCFCCSFICFIGVGGSWSATDFASSISDEGSGDVVGQKH